MLLFKENHDWQKRCEVWKNFVFIVKLCVLFNIESVAIKEEQVLLFDQPRAMFAKKSMY